ncbi:hypothetical protein [Natranaerobius thermophilus]|uniref:Uncharacterized protein n=1 Tax=Natranaerobius thermophilus (strain ATCC BAA-1301 / DSM 18059 / JW/NM-WN-LF) TaxID=457570 RepID=B2A6Q2_NATTJ|nr:hypothetical protein [Natranaerobius thermophilus]ACB84185.1 hypothetical protein Nther_0590 [Natranaerobius thermophilus JW/NM-WN-LF]
MVNNTRGFTYKSAGSDSYSESYPGSVSDFYHKDQDDIEEIMETNNLRQLIVELWYLL